jgi:hypothetical protein
LRAVAAGVGAPIGDPKAARDSEAEGAMFWEGVVGATCAVVVEAVENNEDVPEGADNEVVEPRTLPL